MKAQWFVSRLLTRNPKPRFDVDQYMYLSSEWLRTEQEIQIYMKWKILVMQKLH